MALFLRFRWLGVHKSYDMGICLRATILSIATWTPEWSMIFLFRYTRSDKEQELKGHYLN